tara:strand:+ start:4342 stop:5148 length:807 start_codon:yes stop_codon:yes gene_type:complete
LKKSKIPIVLTIAGSDSGSGAGIQADLKTFSSLGVYGTTAITVVTSQNTKGVRDVSALDLSMISSQIDCLVEDFDLRAIKTGMLFTPDIVKIVSDKAKEYKWEKLIVDPVMVASSGDTLLQSEAIDEYKNSLIPISFAVTPNIPELATLLNEKIITKNDIKNGCVKIRKLGVKNIIVKGGHDDNNKDSIDILYSDDTFYEYSLPRLKSKNNHGTGCTFAAAFTANIALGENIKQSFINSKDYVWNAMSNDLLIGNGNGPVDHFYKLRK